MKAQIKQQQKTLAKYIRSLKYEMKDHMRNGRWYKASLSLRCLMKKKEEYRHRHIAYCLLLGRNLEQIENKVKEGNERVDYLLEHYKKEFSGEETKLYVVLSNRLTPEQKVVQCAHVVAQFMKSANDPSKGPLHFWDNGTLVVMEEKPKDYSSLRWNSLCFDAVFNEPDLSNAVTACAFYRNAKHARSTEYQLMVF